MKKTIFALSLVIISAGFNAVHASTDLAAPLISKTDVKTPPPAAVLAAFATNFGNTPVRQWKLRSGGNWRAHFTWNGMAWEATFTAAGVLVKSERA
ncbi:MAG: hypothetical protein IPP81_18135 [Chitinophagaceae bacterium]|nr:hypothetical protein [Chitinophagaceae bacterium]